MKPIARIFFSLLCLALLCTLFALSISASKEIPTAGKIGACVADPDDLLTSTQKQQIADTMQNAQTGDECDFVFLIYNYRYSSANGYMTVDEVKYFSPHAQKNFMVLEVTRMSSGENMFMVHIFGENERLSQKELEYIEDLIQTDVKAGRFAAAAHTFVEKGERAFHGKLVDWGSLFFRSALLALAGSAVALFAVVYRYKRKLRAAIYPLDQFARLRLSEQSDIQVGKTVTRTRVSSSSSGSSGGGGGGHSSGSRR